MRFLCGPFSHWSWGTLEFKDKKPTTKKKIDHKLLSRVSSNPGCAKKKKSSGTPKITAVPTPTPNLTTSQFVFQSPPVLPGVGRLTGRPVARQWYNPKSIAFDLHDARGQKLPFS